MSSGKCNWCSDQGASQFEIEQDGQRLISSERFCSMKCYSEYSDRYVVNFYKKPSYVMFKIVIIIAILVAILHRMGLV